jgi:hypothetical protein
MMTVIRKISLALVLLLTAAVPVMADTILHPGSNWEYTSIDPTSTANWKTTINTTTGGWETGLAPFGNNSVGYASDPLGYFNKETDWAVNSKLWVRTSVDLTGYDLSSIRWDLGVDNGFKLYLNGNPIANGYAEGYTYRWEYSGDFNSAISGNNVIALELVDRGGLTAFDMQVTGNPNPVPEPTSLLLLGSGLGAIGLAAWRKRK